MIGEIVRQLAETDLRPGPYVNGLFRELVDQACAAGPDHPALLDPEALAFARRVCAEGETHLERTWASRIIHDRTQLEAFPYLANYTDLATAELRLLRSLRNPLRHLVFAGCGPLPLTAVVLHRLDPGLRITCLDSDRSAVTAARAVLDAALGPAHPVTVLHRDAASYEYPQADAVLVAALVGQDSAAKAALLKRIMPRLPAGCLIALRSVPADGRQLLYPRIDPDDLTPGPWIETPSPPTVINSLLVLTDPPPRTLPA